MQFAINATDGKEHKDTEPFPLLNVKEKKMVETTLQNKETGMGFIKSDLHSNTP